MTRNTYENTVRLENISLRMHVNAPSGIRDLQTREGPAGLHDHAFTELFLCSKGKITIKSDIGNTELCCGDIMIVPAGFHHVMSFAEHDSLYFSVNFLVTRKGTATEDLYLRFTPLLSSPVIFKDFDGVKRLEQIIRSTQTDRSVFPAVSFIQILLEMTCKQGTELSSGFGTEIPVSSDIARLAMLDEEIERSYAYKYTSAQIAKKLYISTRQLDRIVVKRYGKTLHQVINDKRLKEAERLLSETEFGVETVAFKSGFGSAAALYREIKKKHGLTPDMYRRNMTEEKLLHKGK